MIQYFWQIDFLGIFLSRLLASSALFILGIRIRKESKIMSVIYFLSGIFVFLGAFSSFISLFWILYLFLKLIITRKLELFELLLISFFILILFIGPGQLSIDRIFELRW